MVAPDNVAAATAAANDIPLPSEPMVVDNGVLDILRSVAHHSGFTVDLRLRAAGREPGEDPTMGDMARLGQIFSEKVFGTDQLLVARQLEAEEDANRRRTEMAADTDHADEYNDIYNELYSLESCVPSNNKHMGKQISTLAAKMREKKRIGGLKMDSAADWIRTH